MTGLVVDSYRFAAPAGGGPITESFNTANSSTLGPDLTWTETETGLEVSSNRARINKGGFTNAEARAEHDLDSDTDQYVQCVTYGATGDSNRRTHLHLRMSASDRTCYAARFRGNGTNLFIVSIVKHDSSGAATSVVGDSASTAYTDGQTIRFEVEGTALRAYINGSLVVSGTDASIASGPRAGFSLREINAVHSIDDFEAGAL